MEHTTISLLITVLRAERSASMMRARFIFLVCADRALNCVRDAIGVLVDLIELTALDQKANF